MRFAAGMTIISTLAVVMIAVGVESSSKKSSQSADELQHADNASGKGLVVHEWGTFTSFSGSDGVRLEYRPLLDEDLPPFVLDRFLQSGVPGFASKSQIRVRMRMETPVTYFYTERERDIKVSVGFPNGLLTEFYPPVEKMLPDYSLSEKPPLTNSVLDWGQVHLIPVDRLNADIVDPQRRQLVESRMLNGLIPAENDSQNHYFRARETDSAIVHVHRQVDGKSRLQPFVPNGDFFEKFLFYRGVGNFELPLKLTALGEGRFNIHNAGPDKIRSLFLVTVDGKTLRMAKFSEVDANSTQTLVQSDEQSSDAELHTAVVEALIDEGLFEKEAEAMVNTWERSWFGEQGTRLFYIVPRRITDQILPLQVQPEPETTVRVLVGRMELMTPEDEERVTKIVQASAALRAMAIAEANEKGATVEYPLPPEIGKLGRLAEPALIRIRATSDDAKIRSEARQLLSDLNAADVAN